MYMDMDPGQANEGQKQADSPRNGALKIGKHFG